MSVSLVAIGNALHGNEARTANMQSTRPRLVKQCSAISDDLFNRYVKARFRKAEQLTFGTRFVEVAALKARAVA